METVPFNELSRIDRAVRNKQLYQDRADRPTAEPMHGRF
jgi:hypothetical protein